MVRIVLALAVALAACGGGEAADTSSTVSTEPSTTAMAPATTVPPTTSAPTTAPTPATLPEDTLVPPPKTGESPDELLGRILADATERTGSDDLEVIRDEAVTWSDGSLGCPEPGVLYQQVLVPGYWVEIDAAGTRLDYRAGASGFFKLCEGANRVPPAPVDPNR